MTLGVTDSSDSTSNRSIADRFSLLLGTGLGVGYCPWAPGTVGSLLGPPLVVAAASFLPQSAVFVFGVLFIVVGVPICTRASKALGLHDPGPVVYDEIAAFWIVFAPLLIRGEPVTWPVAAAGFGLFRLFDITKPWPVNRLEKLPGGLGIMADDLAAGAWSALFLFAGTEIAGRISG